MVLDKEKFLADQKWKADLLINSNKDTNVATSPIASPFSEDWRFDDGYDNIESHRGQPVFGVEEGGQTFFDFPFVKIRGNDQKVAHHLKDHFQDLPPQEILRKHITGEQPLPPEDLERIFGSDYEKQIKELEKKLKTGDQNLAWLRGSGSGNLTRQEFHDGLRIINTTSPNERTRKERETLLIKQAGMGV